MSAQSFPAKTAYLNPGVAAQYDAQRFRSLRGRLGDRREKYVIGRLLAHVPSGARVLDLACGTGRISELLMRQGFDTYGADYSQAMLDVARARLAPFGRLELRQADAAALPFPNGFFESATCIRFLGHVPPEVRARVLGELKRVCRGPFVAAFYLEGSLPKLRSKIGKSLGKQEIAWYPVTPRDLTEELRRVGLKPVKQMRFMPGSRTLLVLVGPAEA
jgi:ubiquinone/menaquinone biosynthesis C-methylase UbiE